MSERDGQEHSWSAWKHCPAKSYSCPNVHARHGTQVILYLEDANLNLVDGEKLQALMSCPFVTGGLYVKVTTQAKERNDRRKKLNKKLLCHTTRKP